MTFLTHLVLSPGVLACGVAVTLGKQGGELEAEMGVAISGKADDREEEALREIPCPPPMLKGIAFILPEQTLEEVSPGPGE